MANPRQFWTDEERQYLIDTWPVESSGFISRKLGKSRNAVIGMAHRMRLPIKNQSSSKPRKASSKPRRALVPYVSRLGKPKPVLKVIHRSFSYTGPIPLLKTKSFHCRAVVEGKDENGLALVCGQHIATGQSFSFCSEHLEQFTTKGGYRYDRGQPIDKQLQGDTEQTPAPAQRRP